MVVNWVITQANWSITVSLFSGYIWRISLEPNLATFIDNFENNFKKNVFTDKYHKFDNSHADLNAFSSSR